MAAGSMADDDGPNGDHVVGFLNDGQPVGTLVDGMLVLGAPPLAWELDRYLNGSDQAPPDIVLLDIANPGPRQTWQQLLQHVSAPAGVVIHSRASATSRRTNRDMPAPALGG
jgi:hypothetical protein